MAGTSPKRIRASVEIWGAGPGMGGKVTIEFRRTDSGWRVIASGSALDCPEQFGSLAPNASWRDRVGFVVTNAEPSHEDHDPDDVNVSGARCVEADLLALAWCGPAGTNAVRLLLNLSDSELAQLSAAASIRTSECIDALEQLSDLCCDDSERLQRIQSSLVSSAFSWEALLEQAATDAHSAEADDAPIYAGQPHTASGDVDRILAAWEVAAGPVSSSVTMWGRSAQKAALRAYVERYLQQYRELPSGVHCIPASFSRSPLDFNVDFDRLRCE